MDVTITKLVHACLLVGVDGKRILIDPGGFTWDDDRFDPSMVEGVDRILITHEHADHVSFDFVRVALERSNGAEVETTPSLQAILAEQGIASVTDGTPQFVSPHEDRSRPQLIEEVSLKFCPIERGAQQRCHHAAWRGTCLVHQGPKRLLEVERGGPGQECRLRESARTHDGRLTALADQPLTSMGMVCQPLFAVDQMPSSR